MTKITEKMFKIALLDTGGIYQQIAKNLKVSRNSVASFVERHPNMRTFIEQERERVLDLMEASLIKKAIVNDDFKAQQFYLKTIGKDRGYVEKTETELSGNVDNHITFELVDSKLHEKKEKNITYKETTPSFQLEKDNTESVTLEIEESPSGQSSTGNDSQ